MSNSPIKTSKLANYISGTETVFYFIVALFLALMAAAVLYQAVHSLFSIDLNGDVTRSLVSTLNEILFVIILLELMSTVYNHLKNGGFQLRPFLIIGIVSSVRRILVLGAQLSTIHKTVSSSEFHSAIMELMVETLVVLALTIALYLHALSKRKKNARKTTAADPQ